MYRSLALLLCTAACTPFEGARYGDAFDSSPAEEAFPGARIEGQGVHRGKLWQERDESLRRVGTAPVLTQVPVDRIVRLTGEKGAGGI